MNRDSLRIAIEYYYWKPAKVFFHSFELEEYARAGIHFEHPFMDLGCGDGIFAAMLQEKGILDYVDLYLDYSINGLWKINKRAGYGVVQADARALPLKTGILASVLANFSLAAVMTNVDQAILEVSRSLVDQGLFVLTVPNSRLGRALLVPKILRKVGAFWLATKWLERPIRRFELYQMLDEEEWLKKLERCSFRVEQVRYYFTPRQAFWWNFLALPIFRVFGLLKILKVPWVKRYAVCIQEKIFRPILEEQSLEEGSKRDQASYLLIVARKTSVGAVQTRSS